MHPDPQQVPDFVTKGLVRQSCAEQRYCEVFPFDRSMPPKMSCFVPDCGVWQALVWHVVILEGTQYVLLA